MSQDNQQPMVPLTAESSTTTTTTTIRKLKRFKSDSSATSTSASISQPSTPAPSSASSFITPSTPPNNSDPLIPNPVSPINPATPPPSYNNEIQENSIEGEQSENQAPDISAPRRILKIAKSAKVVAESKKEVSITPPKVPVATQLVAATKRADGTWRKEVKVRVGQIPKAVIDIRTSTEQAEEIVKVKKTKVKRIRPNTNFLTRILESTERHNDSLLAEDEMMDEAEDGDEDAESDFDEDTSFGMDGANGETSNSEDDEPVPDNIKSQVNNILQTTERSLRKERQYILQQVGNLRKLEGIRVIKGIAKMYGLRVVIPEEEEVLRKNLLGDKPKKRKSMDNDNDDSETVRIVRTTGSIGYNGD